MENPMKIAMMVRAYIPIPRPADMIYAPLDLELQIAKELGARGHEVTIYAPLGSEVHTQNVTVETLNLRALTKNQSEFTALLDNTGLLSNGLQGLWDRYMTNDIYRRAENGEFDLVHFHHLDTGLSAAVQHLKVPTVYTLHDPVHPLNRELLELFASKNQKFISISNNQRHDAPDLPYLATVYNGTNVELFNYSDEAEDYLMYVGRVAQEKGVKEAIQVARGAKRRLLIIGPVDHGSNDYFQQYIKPELDDQILYLGRMDQEQLPKYYQKAAAVLTPIQREEPFGMTTIEALACGAPVISLDRGAAPEIIVDGKTGFIVHSISEMIDAVDKLVTIKRKDCHEHVKKYFSIETMVDGYEAAYRDMIESTGHKAKNNLVPSGSKVTTLRTHAKRLKSRLIKKK